MSFQQWNGSCKSRFLSSWGQSNPRDTKMKADAQPIPVEFRIFDIDLTKAAQPESEAYAGLSLPAAFIGTMAFMHLTNIHPLDTMNKRDLTGAERLDK